MQEKENILRIMEKTKEAITKGDVVTIKSLSNQTINTASLTQDRSPMWPDLSGHPRPSRNPHPHREYDRVKTWHVPAGYCWPERFFPRPDCH